MNGRWLERSEIPADKSRYGAFTVLAEEAEKAVLAIIERAKNAPAGSEAKKVGDLFESFMDEARIEEVGLRPLQDVMARIESALPGGHQDLVGVLGEIERSGVEGLWRLFVDNDPGNPERYVMFVEQGGLSLPDESYYRKPEHAEILGALEVHIERMFTLAGLSDATDRAKRVIELETRIAAGHWDNVKSRDAEATYNMWSGDQLGKALGEFGWQQWLSRTGIPAASVGEIVVRQPSFVESVGQTWMASSPQALADWMSWHTITAFAPYLTGEFVQAHFDFFGTTLSGTPELRARWKRGVSFVEAVMGEAVGKLYVEEHFPSDAKQQMDELVAMLLAAYRASITELPWMGPETKKKALDKLETFRPKIGYPAVWRDYSSLSVTPGDLWANVIAGNEYEFARELRKIGSPLDRDEWFMTPQTVNAYYNPGFNEIVFPAAILQYPFFDPARDAASNYGAIGAVIGHEIGHGFDDQGSRFDGDGRLTNWWTDQDRAAFEERTASLITQFSELAPRDLPGHFVNGDLTIGENIGDLGGLAIAWKAYLMSLEGAEPPVIDDLTAGQRFFLSWAQSWKLAAREEEALRLLQIDPHSPPEFRCNQIARNLDVYYEAFDVTPDHELWLAPEHRVTIW
ncbi:MAG: peptidase M13 [Pontimonas sp.]|nr:peptidase M13 [Pontimonas sp.]